MEIVLLWLDELDDYVFAGYPLWLGLRRLCLAIALLAALGIRALPIIDAGRGGVLLMVAISLYALIIWAIVAIVSHGADRSARTVSG